MAPVEVAPPPPLPTWPEAGAPLRAPAPPTWTGAPPRVFLDPGHGVGGNHGNLSALCEREGDVMMALAEVVAEQLRAGGVEVKLSREAGEQVSYSARMQRAKHWNTEVFISLHSDSRGAYTTDAGGCRHSLAESGFAILYSDEGPMAGDRQQLAATIASEMSAAGYPSYPGNDYTGLYDGSNGIFVDRHEPRKRIMFLRRPAMPSVIIETHHALDREAALRWQEPETVSVFSAALTAGLAQWSATR